MKKLLLVLLVVILASFLFVGCLPTTPAEGEGEGESEGEVTVEIEGEVVYDGKIYLSRGDHTITVTFPVPVAGWVKGYITYCSGDYSKEDKILNDGTEVVLFPNEDRTIWIGSGSFRDSASWCCASYLEIFAGECEDEACIRFPVIVDCEPPYLLLELDSDACTCEGVFVDFMVDIDPQECAEDIHCCNDDCTALVSGSLAVYDKDPFNDCCETPCTEPLWTCSFSECPDDVTIPLCTTSCLVPQAISTNGIDYTGNPEAPTVYYLVVKLADVVGNENAYYAQFILALDESDDKANLFCQRFYEDINDCACTSWTYGPDTDPLDEDDWVGYCYYQNYCGQGNDKTNWLQDLATSLGY